MVLNEKTIWQNIKITRLEMRNYSAYRILCLTYTALYSKNPYYLYDIIKLKEHTSRLRASNSLLLSNQNM